MKRTIKEDQFWEIGATIAFVAFVMLLDGLSRTAPISNRIPPKQAALLPISAPETEPKQAHSVVSADTAEPHVEFRN